MRIGLFIPCFIEAFFPEVGIATLELLGHDNLPTRSRFRLDNPHCDASRLWVIHVVRSAELAVGFPSLS
jgi:hypothetical protein